MANLRQRGGTTVKSPPKRTSSRVTAPIPSKYEEVKIDSDGSEDILMDTESDEGESEIINGSAPKSTTSSDDLSIDEEDSLEEGEESEDDKEIRRIIEKTEAETRNISLTARQRAKLEGGIQESAPENDSKTDNILSSEQALKLSEKSRRRKLQRAQKIEETKRATIDRLLQKQKKTPAPSSGESEVKESETEDLSVLKPGIVRFIDRPNETFLQFPDDSTYETAISHFHTSTSTEPRDRSKKCQICQRNEGKYTHPKSGQLFCSLACYKLIE